MDKNTQPFNQDSYTHNIERNQERVIDRRSFMKLMAGAAGVFAASTLPWGGLALGELMGLRNEEIVRKRIVAVKDVQIGQAIVFAYPTEHDSALLIRTDETTYKAYQNACTHLRCPVVWSPAEQELLCPCHHGKFAVDDGRPLAGPPRRPLPEIMLQFEQGTIYAVGVKDYEV